MNKGKRHRNYWPEIGYGLQIAAGTAVGGVMGGALDYGLNKLNEYKQIAFQTAKRLDDKAGHMIAEKGGPVGETAIEVDKAQGNLWSRIFGITPEKQREWRQKHGLEQPTYTQKPEEKTQTVTVVQQPEPVPVPKYEGSNLGLTIGLLAGAGYSAITHLSGYLRARRERNTKNALTNLQEETTALNNRLTKIEEGVGAKVKNEGQ